MYSWNKIFLMDKDSSIDIDFSLSDEYGNVVLTPLIENSWSGSVICGQWCFTLFFEVTIISGQENYLCRKDVIIFW